MSALQEEMKQAIREVLTPLIEKETGPIKQMLATLLNEGSPELLTVKATAKILKVHPKTVRNYCQEGRLRFIRKGHTMMIESASVFETTDR